VFTNKTRKQLFKNFLSLLTIQTATYILPLITIPYLLRVLGPTKIGLIAFSQAIIEYFQILVDYGFSLSATREISINRDDKNKVSEIFSSVMIIKFVLFLLSLIIMSIIVFSFAKFRQNWLIYYFTVAVVLGQTLFPIWFFQGIEKMKYITFLNVISKIIYVIFIFIIVKKSSDYLYVPLISGISYIIAGILALWIVLTKFGVSFKIVSLEKLKIQLKDGWHIFVSQISITLLSNTNIFVLGLFTNNTIVGYYSVADKLIRAMIDFQIPIINSIYPYMAKLIKDDINKAISFIKKLLVYGTLVYFIFSIVFWLISGELITALFGANYSNSVIIFNILLIVPLAIFIDNIYGTQLLINLGHSDRFSKVLFIGGITNLILCPILTYFFSYIGTAVSWALVELAILYIMYLSTTKYVPELNLKHIFVISIS